MKIILLQTYENVGNVGEIVTVKNGFARNFLIPNKIAAPATEKNINELKVYLKAQEIKEAKNRTNMEALEKQLSKTTIKLELQAGEDDKLFGSVTSQMITEELAKAGYTIDKKEVLLEEPIKSLGNHKVEINLGYELKPKIKIKISAAKK
tara:strand:- start:3166 stop:3615 length:450 start_codon:yes stop_codon:yes gene_type:complete